MRSTSTAVEWFKAIKNKAKCRCIKFDIAEFYPSISIGLLDRSVSFAKSLIDIEGNIINTINHARKSLLFDDRDNGSAIVHKTNGSKVDRLIKDIIRLFKDERMSTTIDTKLFETDFSDVSFNLNTGTCFPFKKLNNTPLYIDSKSNHPPSIIKQLPSMTNNRISCLYCDKTEFNKAKITYEKALKSSGYQATLKFEKPSKNTRRNRNKEVIWFNPPFSLNVKTNIGKEFFKLIRKHLPRNHSFRKILNLNTIKISYSSMENMKNLIKQHNARVLKNHEHSEKRSCNCRVKDNCPLDGKCLYECIVHHANVVTNNECKEYFGTAEREFKLRYSNGHLDTRNV